MSKSICDETWGDVGRLRSRRTNRRSRSRVAPGHPGIAAGFWRSAGLPCRADLAPVGHFVLLQPARPPVSGTGGNGLTGSFGERKIGRDECNSGLAHKLACPCFEVVSMSAGVRVPPPARRVAVPPGRDGARTPRRRRPARGRGGQCRPSRRSPQPAHRHRDNN